MTLGLHQKVTKSKSGGLLLIHPHNPRPNAGLAECLNPAERIIGQLLRFTAEAVEPLARFFVLTKERSLGHDRNNATAGGKLIEGMPNVVDVRTVCKRRIHQHPIVLAAVFQEVSPSTGYEGLKS